MKVIRKHGLEIRLGYFTGDNNAKNDTCLRKVAEDLLRDYGIAVGPAAARTRCADHIINLSLQAFLFASSEEALRPALLIVQTI